MAVLTRDDYFTRLQTMLGSDTSDEAISFLEDMTDTYNEMEQRANGDGVDWEQRYRELDESWKEKYRHRFFSSGGGSYTPPAGTDDGPDDDQRRASTIGFDDLFKEGFQQGFIAHGHGLVNAVLIGREVHTGGT